MQPLYQALLPIFGGKVQHLPTLARDLEKHGFHVAKMIIRRGDLHGLRVPAGGDAAAAHREFSRGNDWENLSPLKIRDEFFGWVSASHGALDNDCEPQKARQRRGCRLGSSTASCSLWLRLTWRIPPLAVQKAITPLSIRQWVGRSMRHLKASISVQEPYATFW